jgi:hypothetical protein
MTDVTPVCKGKQDLSEHGLIELGRCPHEVGEATYTYLEFGCPDCGITARQTVIFACGTRAKRIEPTVENCSQ